MKRISLRTYLFFTRPLHLLQLQPKCIGSDRLRNTGRDTTRGYSPHPEMNHIRRDVARGYLPQSKMNHISRDVAGGYLPQPKMNYTYISRDVARGSYLPQHKMIYCI